MGINKKIVIFGGGTFSHVRSHLALAAPAFGTTARELAQLCSKRIQEMDVELVLTKMAGGAPYLETNENVKTVVDNYVNNNTTKVIIFSAALCDFNGEIGITTYNGQKEKKYGNRLSSSNYGYAMRLTPAEKIISGIRKNRKDIFLVGFKTTCGATVSEQFTLGLNLLKTASCNLVVANDVKTRETFIITPEESVYGYGLLRTQVFKELVDMIYWRTHLSFTRSTVVDGNPVPWEEVKHFYPNLTKVVEYCISQGAYKPFNGATVGHFALKMEPNLFLTSIRKTNFNDIASTGMVRVRTDGPDDVIAYGAKPSVGGQSQRIIFGQTPDVDCIVHFHCPLKSDHKDDIPVVSQREYECGSHECGENTAKGLKVFKPSPWSADKLYCVMLDRHGPNIVFHHSVHAKYVIEFINRNFDLSGTTAGFKEVLFDRPSSTLTTAQELLR
jgi:hypothetical protein